MFQDGSQNGFKHKNIIYYELNKKVCFKKSVAFYIAGYLSSDSPGICSVIYFFINKRILPLANNWNRYRNERFVRLNEEMG
jgi:hypothetical protein